MHYLDNYHNNCIRLLHNLVVWIQKRQVSDDEEEWKTFVPQVMPSKASETSENSQNFNVSLSETWCLCVSDDVTVIH